MLDNLMHPLESEFVASLLTATTIEDRILGVSRTARVPARALIVTTANNPVFSADLMRRRVRVKLDARMVNPLDRTFRHDDLAGWAKAHV